MNQKRALMSKQRPRAPLLISHAFQPLAPGVLRRSGRLGRLARHIEPKRTAIGDW